MSFHSSPLWWKTPKRDEKHWNTDRKKQLSCAYPTSVNWNVRQTDKNSPPVPSDCVGVFPIMDEHAWPHLIGFVTRHCFRVCAGHTDLPPGAGERERARTSASAPAASEGSSRLHYPESCFSVTVSNTHAQAQLQTCTCWLHMHSVVYSAWVTCTNKLTLLFIHLSTSASLVHPCAVWPVSHAHAHAHLTPTYYPDESPFQPISGSQHFQEGSSWWLHGFGELSCSHSGASFIIELKGKSRIWAFQTRCSECFLFTRQDTNVINYHFNAKAVMWAAACWGFDGRRVCLYGKQCFKCSLYITEVSPEIREL